MDVVTWFHWQLLHWFYIYPCKSHETFALWNTFNKFMAPIAYYISSSVNCCKNLHSLYQFAMCCLDMLSGWHGITTQILPNPKPQWLCTFLNYCKSVIHKTITTLWKIPFVYLLSLMKNYHKFFCPFFSKLS